MPPDDTPQPPPPTLLDPRLLLQAKSGPDALSNRQRPVRRFYSQQNRLIDQYLGAEDEERAAEDEELRLRPRVRFAVYGSFAVNGGLFVIQLYAAVKTGSLSLFATAADAFMDLISSCIMVVTSRLARRPSIYRFPVGRTRIEPVGIIVFCALMATVAVELMVGHFLSRFVWARS
ncbi:cation diffusion facilitator 1 [Ophiocordyceps camponoti-floridani]|uniref:Cation diffusion facilitator 1 n=1 Tax=Ophiocordyceps camponoti-floridani TaxID=2030778 RepID=A0A8H4VDP8_9HYPO|nr:cation diffusion facilitator 1 [Ophiocordyceps camponoti-floridani]